MSDEKLTALRVALHDAKFVVEVLERLIKEEEKKGKHKK